MRYFIFNTGGDWDSTTLFLNGDEYPANKLYIEIQAPTDEFGNVVRGGLSNGGQIQAYLIPQDPNPIEQAIFPGRIDLEFPTHKISIINESPQFAVEMTSIILDGQEIADQITEMIVNIDAIENEVSAYVTVYKHHVFAADEVATYTLL
jgi:hypothetical protein